MSWTEVLAFATGVACVWLIVRQNVWSWPIGIANSAFLIVVLVPARLYADTGLQVIYIGLGLYGWWHWIHGNPLRRDALPVRRTPRLEGAVVVAVTAVAFVALGTVLDRVTDTDVPWADAFPAVASLAAQYLLTRKYLASWAVWIFAVNAVYLALYAWKGLPLLAALQLGLAAVSVAGWVEWRRSLGTVLGGTETVRGADLTTGPDGGVVPRPAAGT